MNITRILNARARACIGAAVLIVATAWAVSIPALPAEPTIPSVPANCDEWAGWNPGDSGCVQLTGRCSLISPNYGINWTTYWFCCYDSSGNLEAYNPSADGPWCYWGFNGGCCNNLDYAPHCSVTPTCPLTGP